MPKAPLPDSLPGTMFILEWKRDRETFVIHVDDANYSSFDLGGDVQQVMLRFRLWGMKDVGDRAIDTARCFGGANVHIPTGRVVSVFDRDADRKRAVRFEEDEEHVGTGPILRSHL